MNDCLSQASGELFSKQIVFSYIVKNILYRAAHIHIPPPPPTT